MTSEWLQQSVQWMQAIQAVGWLGWLFAAACLVFIPGSVLTLGAGAIYGFWLGIFLVLVGNGLSALCSLLITRYLLRDWAVKYFAKYPKMEALKTAVEEDGWKIVCLTHLSPIMPFSLINYALGLTSISVTEFLLATEVGSIPATIIYVYLGTLIGNLAKIAPEIHRHRPLEWLLQGLGLIVTIAVTIYIARASSVTLKKRLQSGGA